MQARAQRMFAVQAFGQKLQRLDANSLNRRQLAKDRGEIYLDYAQRYFLTNDLDNALSVAEEGLIMTGGPFYLAVRDQLEDVKKKIQEAMVFGLDSVLREA